MKKVRHLLWTLALILASMKLAGISTLPWWLTLSPVWLHILFILVGAFLLRLLHGSRG